MGRPDPLTRLGLLGGAGLLVAASLLTGCATPSAGPAPAAGAGGAGGVGLAPAAAGPDRRASGPARQGTRAPSQVERSAPFALVLPGGARAEVVPVATVEGRLAVPEHVDRLGWWDGSAWLGDPFGATVIAGHVDSATDGIGFFARLLAARVGDRVSVVGAKGGRQAYRVTSVRTVTKDALSTDGRALDQTGDHRLVLITCTGEYRPGRGYEANLVVMAQPV